MSRVPTLIAPLGFTPEKFLYGVRTAGFVDRVIVVGGPVVRESTEAGDYDRHLEAQDEVVETLAQFGTEVDVHEVKDAFDFPGWIQTVRTLVADHRDDVGPAESEGGAPAWSVACDISAGPGALQAAVLFAAMVEGIPVHFANHRARSDLWLPMVDLPYTNLLNERQREILAMLSEGTRSSSELAKELGLTGPTISHHLERLRSSGLIQREPTADGRVKRWRLSPSSQALL